MSRKGRFLEILIKHLQEFLSPQGFEIKSPELFHHNGKQIGEIDVTIRGKLGSASIFIGIECRDRPRGKPQGIPWLTQIQGKRQLFKVDKMIAVSTTGFVPEAIKVAEDLNIDLLTINAADEIDLADWFHTIDFSWQEETYNIAGKIDFSIKPNNITGMRSFKLNTPFLMLDGSNHLATLDEYIKPDIEHLFTQLPQVDKGVIQAEVSIQRNVRLNAELDGERFMITKIAIPVKLSREVVRGGFLLTVCKNVHQDEVTAITGIATVETSKRKIKILAIAKKSASATSLMDLRTTLLNDNNEPYIMPEGSTVSLYGIK